MLVIVRLAGPRAARTVAQVTIALFGGAMVIASQVMRYGGGATARNGFGVVYHWGRVHHFGQNGWASWPGRAGFGDPLALAGVVIAALALFAVTGVLFERHFVAAFQQAGHYDSLRPRQRRPSRAGMRARFSGSLARTMLGKEMALLRRNPQILATMLLRLVYLVPMMLVLLQRQSHGVVFPAMAFVGVFVVTQLTGDLAWLVISGEDTPDLLAVAPVARAMIGRTKAIVAMAMAAPLLAAVALGIGSRAPVLGLAVLPIGLAGSAAAASIQLRLERPTPRKAFGRRNRGASIAANLLVLLVALMLGGLSASVGWWLTAR
jgi:ABC-2 type transport system permease protein